MIISINIVKAFDKIQHPLVAKTLSKLEINGSFLNLIKGIYKKFLQLTLYLIIRNGMLPHKIRNKTRMSSLTTLPPYWKF